MPRLTGPQIVSELRRQLQNQSGRHLYVVLGTYKQLENFEQLDLQPGFSADEQTLPQPVNFNRELLALIEDDALRKMVRDENRRPKAVESQLNLAFEQLLRKQFESKSLLTLKNCELMFAYRLDLSRLRTYASNQNHLLLLLPGRKLNNQIRFFHEAEERFQTQFPGQLVTENNLWELTE